PRCRSFPRLVAHLSQFQAWLDVSAAELQVAGSEQAVALAEWATRIFPQNAGSRAALAGEALDAMSRDPLPWGRAASELRRANPTLFQLVPEFLDEVSALKPPAAVRKTRQRPSARPAASLIADAFRRWREGPLKMVMPIVILIALRVLTSSHSPAPP